jgi:hypothetical protein
MTACTCVRVCVCACVRVCVCACVRVCVCAHPRSAGLPDWSDLSDTKDVLSAREVARLMTSRTLLRALGTVERALHQNLYHSAHRMYRAVPGAELHLAGGGGAGASAGAGDADGALPPLEEEGGVLGLLLADPPHPPHPLSSKECPIPPEALLQPTTMWGHTVLPARTSVHLGCPALTVCCCGVPARCPPLSPPPSRVQRLLLRLGFLRLGAGAAPVPAAEAVVVPLCGHAGHGGHGHVLEPHQQGPAGSVVRAAEQGA